MITAAIVLAGFIQAQAGACLPDGAIQKRLAEVNKEEMIFSGANGDGVVVELWANFDAGTWSILTVRRLSAATNLSCMIAFGDGATVRRPKPRGTPL